MTTSGVPHLHRSGRDRYTLKQLKTVKSVERQEFPTIKLTSPLRTLPIAAALILSLGFGLSPALAGSAQKVTFTNVQVSHDTYPAHSEPTIAENPTNSKDLIAGSKMFTDPARYDFKIGMYYSKDGGATWHDDGFLPGFENYTTDSDISVAFDAGGTAYACVLAEDAQGGSGVFVSTSSDGGKTWSQPHTVFYDQSGATFSDKPWIAVDTSKSAYRGRVYVAWNLDDNSVSGDSGAGNHDPDGGGDAAAFANHAVPSQAIGVQQTGLVVSRSIDAGLTWSEPEVLVAFDNQSPIFALGAIPQVGPNGHVHIAYLKWNDTESNPGVAPNTLEMASSSDGGVTFNMPRTIVSRVDGLPNTLPNSTFRNLSLPSFAVSPKDGSMAIVWADDRNGDADIYAASSANGKQWTTPYRVNHDHLANGKDQFQPEIAVAPNGTYTCSWFDRRHDPADTLIDVDIAQSADDAHTFGKNFRITAQSWDSTIDSPRPDPNSNLTFIGDYQGLAVDNTTVHPLWNDTQNGKSQQIRTVAIAERVFINARSK
jgi:hypothetical protein